MVVVVQEASQLYVEEDPAHRQRERERVKSRPGNSFLPLSSAGKERNQGL